MGCGGNRPRVGGVQRVVRTVGVGLTCALVAGCGGGVVGAPVAELWDPCSLPAEVLEGVGVEPGVVNSNRQDSQGDEWRFCTFDADWAFLTVFATTASYALVSTDSRATNRVPVTVDGRPAVEFEIPEVSSAPSCFVALERRFGATQFRVTSKSTEPPPVGVCDVVREYADVLIRFVPE